MRENMNMETMKKYQGRQEVPMDFDAFWDENIASLPKNPECRLSKRDFSMGFLDCYELNFTGVHTSNIYAKCLFPSNKEKVPTIFYFHGYPSRSPDWAESIKYVAAGYGVVCMDVRGQNGNSDDAAVYLGNTSVGHILRGIRQGKEHLFYRNVYLDVYQLVEIVSGFAFVDSDKLISFGGSQGAAQAVAAAALNKKIKSTIIYNPFLSDFKRVLELGSDSPAYAELDTYFRMQDVFHQKETEILEALAYIDVKNFAHRIKADVKMLIGLADVVCPPSTQFAIYNRLETEKELKVIPGYGHEAMNVKVNDLFFNWVTGSNIEI